MKKLLLLFLAVCISLFWTNEVRAVGGISNSKVVVPSTDTVPKKMIEIEPFANFLFADDENDTKTYRLGARITYGLLSNIEFGATFFFVTFEDDDLININTNFGNFEPGIGIKWRFLEQQGNDLFSFSLAYEGGVTIPIRSAEKWAFEPLGLILTKNFSERFSMDNDIVLRLVEDEIWGIITNHGLGYYITDWLQPVAEMAYIYNNIDNQENEHVLNVTGGFTADLTDYAILIIGVTKDLVSENTDDTLVITSALTFIF
jgi:hypothetical protein